MGPLLKLYQNEIDQLTRRSRFAENAFLSLYKSLYEAPDPAPSLNVAVDDLPKATGLAIENRRLLKEVVFVNHDLFYLFLNCCVFFFSLLNMSVNFQT